MGISKWNAGVIRPVAVAPTGPYQNSSAPGVWTLDQQAYWQKQGLWPTAGNVQNYIEDVFSTYLYTGTGKPQTIVNGIAIGSAYGGTVYFDGTSDSLSLAANSAFAFGTGDFTIEFWVNYASASSNYALYDGRGLALSNAGIVLYTNASTIYAQIGTNSPLITATSPTANVWHHIAFTRAGSANKLFVDGTQVGSTATNSTNLSGLFAVGIGDFIDPGYSGIYGLNGNLSNLRVVKGTAVYTANFTPPTAPLTAISGTSLLTCQSPSPTTDYSSNAFTITVTNAIAQNGGGPFADSTAGKGGMVWVKSRSAATNNLIGDTVNGTGKTLIPNSTSAILSNASYWPAWNSNGFDVSSDSTWNANGATFASWTFREQAKFFDVVTYTGNGANRTISHNLGSVPGCIIVKRTDTTADWQVYHRSLANTQYLVLNDTAAAATGATRWNSTTPTSTVFSIGTDTTVNASGGTYVAYIFAHDAGGFGLTGTDNVISCGSFTTDGSGNATVNLGYEPQWIIRKRADNTSNWVMQDNMRGLGVLNSTSSELRANTSQQEFDSTGVNGNIFATGFNQTGLQISATYIYIAIRRGPMKTPTTGTSVFNPTATTATTGTVITTSFPVDAQIIQYRTPAGGNVLWQDRLRGVNTTATEGNNPVLTSNDTSAEQNTFSTTRYWDNTGYQISATLTGQNRIYWNFRRAPGFFDEVCYTGTGSALAVTHNLGVTPELVIWKARNQTAYGWKVTSVGLTNPNTYYLTLNSVNGETDFSANFIYNRTATTVTFSPDLTQASYNNVVYLFATCPGVSKVGSYTGTGALQTIPCGFASGARFVLVKATSTTGDWYVWDSARGISSSTDPYLLLNSTAAEVTSTNWVDTDSTGFKLTAASGNLANTNGTNYIFLAIS